MSGQWPPEWDDPEDLPGEGDQQDTETQAGLSEVAAYLASVPAPVMPGSVEARISAALAVEAAARAGIAVPASGDASRDGVAGPDGIAQPDGTIPSEAAAGARVLGPAPDRARVRRRGAHERRREREVRRIFEPRRERDVRTVLGKFVLGPLAVVLLIVIAALGLSRVGGSSSSSSANSLGMAPQGAAAAGSASAAGGESEPASSAAASAPMAVPSPAGTSAGFTVSQTGTTYQRATLAQQAQARVLAPRADKSAQTALPSASSPSSAAAPASSGSGSGSSSSGSVSSVKGPALVPSAALRACVLKVTGGVLPKLVDRATYQGTPAYIIATSNRVWVVGLGCTAASPQVIVSVPLAG
jgi:hypothetical protein